VEHLTKNTNGFSFAPGKSLKRHSTKLEGKEINKRHLAHANFPNPNQKLLKHYFWVMSSKHTTSDINK